VTFRGRSGGILDPETAVEMDLERAGFCRL